MPNIVLKNIEKVYGGTTAPAVTDINLTINDGEFMCLLGPSGCGKTTTLRMIAGLEHPTAGSIQIGEQTVDDVKAGIFVPPEKRGLGLVFQSYALWPHLTIEKNVDFGLRLRKVPKEERIERTNDVMRKLGIERYADRYPNQLSGGQQQRVALARMLAVNPGVLLLDEPLSNLDARLRLEMRAELKRIHAEFGTTIVFVTHDQWEAMTLATQIAVMSEGHLQQLGSPSDIYDRPANRFVAEFVGNPPMNIIEFDTDETSLIKSVTWDYAARRHSDITKKFSVGLRPESIYVRTEASADADVLRLEASVISVMPTGGNWIVELAAGNGKLFATTSILPHLHSGDKVFLEVDPENVHVYNEEGLSKLYTTV